MCGADGAERREEGEDLPECLSIAHVSRYRYRLSSNSSSKEKEKEERRREKGRRGDGGERRGERETGGGESAQFSSAHVRLLLGCAQRMHEQTD